MIRTGSHQWTFHRTIRSNCDKFGQPKFRVTLPGLGLALFWLKDGYIFYDQIVGYCNYSLYENMLRSMLPFRNLTPALHEHRKQGKHLQWPVLLQRLAKKFRLTWIARTHTPPHPVRRQESLSLIQWIQFSARSLALQKHTQLCGLQLCSWWTAAVRDTGWLVS